MPIAKTHIRFLPMPKMAVRLIGAVIHIIPFFKHRIIVGSGCLKVIHLRGVREQSRFCGLLDPIAIYRRLAGATGEVIIVTVTEHHVGGFQFEMRQRGVKCRAKPDITAIELGK